MKRFSQMLYKRITNRVLIISIAVFIVFIAAVSVPVSGYTERVTNSSESPDTSFIYSTEDLFDMAETYGEQGRRVYIILRFTFDLAFPFVYLFFMASLLTKLLSYLPQKSRLRCFNILPFIGVFFDFLENITAAIFMGVYPQKAYTLAYIASYATPLKWIFLGVSFALMLVLAVYKLITLVTKKIS